MANSIKTTMSLFFSCENNSLLHLQVTCAFFINERTPMTMQGQGRHWPLPNLCLLRLSGSMPGSFSPQINYVGLAHTQVNNNTIN
eukprot:13398159-Ditylum_brightwellii.AAC.1